MSGGISQDDSIYLWGKLNETTITNEPTKSNLN